MLAMFEGFRAGRAHAREEYRDAPLGSNEAPGDAAETKILAKVTAMAEALQARVDELEAERDASPLKQLIAVLALPGVKTWLLAKFHPDKHPNANDAERELHTQNVQKINAAYEFVERSR
jgi:hypothetical protein